MNAISRGVALDQALSREAASSPSRRRLLGVMIGSLLGLPLLSEEAAAKRKKRRKNKRRKGKKGNDIPTCGVCQTLEAGQCVTSPDLTPCGGNRVCREGVCDCPPFQKECQGTCIPNTVCCVDGDCPAGRGETCQDGECACPPGLELSGGVCAERPTCSGRGDTCGSEFECCSFICDVVDGTCFASGPNRQCFDDSDCLGNLVCMGFVCTEA